MGDHMRKARHTIRDLRRSTSEIGTESPRHRSPLLESLLVSSGNGEAHAQVERAESGQFNGMGLPGVPEERSTRSGKELWQVARARSRAAVFTMHEVKRVAKDGGGMNVTMSMPVRGEAEPPPGLWSPASDCCMLWGSVRSSPSSLMLVCVPLGVAAALLQWSPTLVFSLNFLALIPLALLLGEVTEDLATRFGDAVGGLLNATFGNVVEMILSIVALNKGLFSVVAMSLIGSILSNLLLVLGCCFLFGGIKYREQTFNALANKASCSLLFMACISVSIPTASRHLYSLKTMSEADDLLLSRITALVLAIVYCCYLYFQLRTHSTEFAGEEEEGEPNLSLVGAMAMLLGITLVVALCSEYLTGAIEDVSKHTGLSQDFLGLVVLPIAGNACEHITAVFVAFKDKMDLSIGIALGSSIQIAIFVIPVVVLVGWVIGQPFSLNFDPFSVVVLTLSVIHVQSVTADARSNWLMGLQLVTTYLLVGTCFFFVREEE